MNQQDCLGETAMFISELKGRIEKLREIRDLKSTIRIRGTKRTANASQSNPTISRNAAAPVIEVRSGDTNLEVILVSNLHNRFRLHRVIDILNEEGADVKNANVSVVGDKVFYTIHSKDLSSRIGLEASRVLERLRDVVS